MAADAWHSCGECDRKGCSEGRPGYEEGAERIRKRQSDEQDVFAAFRANFAADRNVADSRSVRLINGHLGTSLAEAVLITHALCAQVSDCALACGKRENEAEVGSAPTVQELSK